jgi:hypothetical protein
VLGDVKASKQWWEVACEECQEAFNPAAADYWLGVDAYDYISPDNITDCAKGGQISIINP